MSEELTGRARGRGRFRTRLQTSACPCDEQRRPDGVPRQHQQQQQQQDGLSLELLAKQRMGRGRSSSNRPREAHHVERVTQLIQDLSLDGGLGERESTVPRNATGLSVKQGTSGTPTILKANYFKLQTVTEWALYQYRVDFAPDEERNAVRKALLRAHSESLGPYIFDGTVLYTIKQLHPDPLELYSARLSDELKILITIKKTTDLVMGDPNYIQFFNIVIRKCIARLDMQLVGRDYFDAAMKVKIPKYKMELWPGFVTSVRQHEHDVLLGVDLANKVMRKDTVLNLLSELTQRSPDNWKPAFLESIVGATVITPYNNKSYRIDDVDFDITPVSTFDKGIDKLSFIDYYYQRYQIRISNAHQPLLISRPKAMDLRGGKNAIVVLIPELCCMTGLTDEMRNNFHLMRELEIHTRLEPGVRMDKISTFMKRLTTNTKAGAELSLWNLKFSPDLVELTGRTLFPERIQHGGQQYSAGTADADWTRSLRGHSMYYGKEFHSWAIVHLQKHDSDVMAFCRTLTNASASIQFEIPTPNYVDIPDDRSCTYVQAIERILAKSNPQLIMCIVPNNRADRYAAIKKKCCVDRSVPSQVVVYRNLTSKAVMSIATKIAIQVNCKIGGSPWSLVVPFKRPAMVVGFDVCHDTTYRGRSYGAMVASLDGAYSTYFSSASPHLSGEELSNEFAIQLVKAVFTYRNLNGFLPPKIIIFRDSVGEGNEHYCLQHEVEPIRSKLQNIYGGQSLQMAFVIVSKRINTRLFLNGGNPPPGTIADHVITNPIKYDFFLISQSVKRGSVTPTSYNVIFDTSQLSPDIMQRLTFIMTHLYFNWTGTVRVPAAVQYAHKLAFLCGQHLHRQPNQQLNQLLYFL